MLLFSIMRNASSGATIAFGSPTYIDIPTEFVRWLPNEREYVHTKETSNPSVSGGLWVFYLLYIIRFK